MPLARDLRLTAVKQETGAIHLLVEVARPTAACPFCGEVSSKTRSRYERAVRDVAWCGIPVVVRFRARRFACANPTCPQRIFCERIPELAPAYGRRTVRFTKTIAALGQAASAEAAARLAHDLGLPISADTVLRILRATKDPELPTPRVLGVDEWAWRKGHSYGTILIDLETHKVVDLLPDRQASTFHEWLISHPGVEIISRDRFQAYAEAARDGAPKARQVADRWHLLNNLGEALERWFSRLQPKLPQTSPPADPCVAEKAAPPTRGQQNRQNRFVAVHDLAQQGLSCRQIAKTLNLSRRTVHKYVHAEQCPQMAKRKPSPTLLDDYLGYLRNSLAAGRRNTRILFEEIQAMGYQGSRSTVARWVRAQREDIRQATKPKTALKAIAPRKLRCWFLTPLGDLSRNAIEPLTQLLRADRELMQGYTLVRLFHTMVRHRAGHALPAWLNAVHKSGIPELERFAASLKKDYAAVYAGLTEPWSQGPVEGINNRLKLIKRLMYGRANFDLLRKRVICAP